MKVIKVKGWISGTMEFDVKEITIVKEKILCILPGISGIDIYLEGGLCVHAKENYDEVLNHIQW